jgi:hypothetical protein
LQRNHLSGEACAAYPTNAVFLCLLIGYVPLRTTVENTPSTHSGE